MRTLRGARFGQSHATSAIAGQMTRPRSATISPVRIDFSHPSDTACVLCALRSTLLSSQEVAARSAYARSKPG
ncbi:Uncharacterised protein [Achromobacter sp. 2789STDY5608615]|nr:hypothetical protein LMG26846_02742 [Achromobacter insuavis]CUI82297.1 Uncharacterised protein [Achromobacter sp. 2789STDY5608621]CUK08648.1 Uncharacterised protein [Achromobacter sp. 2789STDY5608615]